MARITVRLIVIFLLALQIWDTQAQEPACQKFLPSQYAYETLLVESSGNEGANCNNTMIDGTQYTHCIHPGRLTDNDLGPLQFQGSNSTAYYHWRQEETQILFTFPSSIILTSMRFFYYIDTRNNIGRPKIRIFLVNENFRVSDTTMDGIESITVDDSSQEESDGRGNITTNLSLLQSSTTKVLLIVGMHKHFRLALSEVEFCIAGELTSSTDVTVSTGSTGTVGQPISSTLPATATGSTKANNSTGLASFVTTVSSALGQTHLQSSIASTISLLVLISLAFLLR